MADESLQEKCKDFNKEWIQHKQNIQYILVEIADMNLRIDSISQNAHHLQKLEPIATSLETMQAKMLDAITGKKQVPLNVVLALILAFSVIYIVTTIKSTDKNFRFSWKEGFEITNSHKEISNEKSN